jgi:hypothetical protein
VVTPLSPDGTPREYIIIYQTNSTIIEIILFYFKILNKLLIGICLSMGEGYNQCLFNLEPGGRGYE